MKIHDQSFGGSLIFLFLVGQETVLSKRSAAVGSANGGDSGRRDNAIVALSDRLFTDRLSNAKRWQHSRFGHDSPCAPFDRARGASSIASPYFASSQRLQRAGHTI
jgi:hypothetical protein